MASPTWRRTQILAGVPGGLRVLRRSDPHLPLAHLAVSVGMSGERLHELELGEGAPMSDAEAQALDERLHRAVTPHRRRTRG